MCDAAGQLALLRLGLGWGCLPRYQVQGLLDSGELVCMTVRGFRLVNARGSPGMTPPAVWLANGGGKRY